MKVEVYSDVVCPWCYIGERRFARALGAFPGGEQVEVVYRPYQLDPAAPQQPVPTTEYLARRFGADKLAGMQQHVVAAARGEGIEMDFARSLAVNTLTAHRLLRLAEHEAGPAAQRALSEKLFAAHFEHGADVSDPELLAGLAESVGLDAARVRAYLGSDEGLAETREEIAHAAQLGIRAVPTFVIDGRYALQGAQPTSTFLAALEQVAAEAAQGGVDGANGDACADGSCAL